jgi:hypothetical protein
MRKSRLVIKGYRQKEGVDYYETFAAVSRMDSVRSIVASSVLKGWKLHQFDAVTAFLHGDADTVIYMELPEGFQEEGYVCCLRRSLYGLKQAPRIWYQCVQRVLVAHGLTMAYSDNCVFYKKDCVVCVYVDDFLVAAASDQEIADVKEALESEFKMKMIWESRIPSLVSNSTSIVMGLCRFTNSNIFRRSCLTSAWKVASRSQRQ